MVGVSGSSGERFAEVTAIARSLPDLICERAEGTEDDERLTWPPRVSVSACDAPLVGYVRKLDAGGALQELGRPDETPCRSRRCERDPARIGPSPLRANSPTMRTANSLRPRTRRSGDDERDRTQITERVVRQLRVERRVDREVAGLPDHQGVAVGRRT